VRAAAERDELEREAEQGRHLLDVDLDPGPADGRAEIVLGA